MGASAAKGVISKLPSLFGGGSSGSSGNSPQQAALAQYTAGQQVLAQKSAAANSGLGASTMNTYRQSGSNILEALSASQMADQNAANQQSLQQLAQSNQGFNQGFNSQGNFGTPSGNFGTNTGNAGVGGTPSDASGGEAIA
jgi:hypothetical protein